MLLQIPTPTEEAEIPTELVTPKKGHRRTKSWGLHSPSNLPPTEETKVSLTSPQQDMSSPVSVTKSPKVFPKFPSFGKGKTKKKKKGHNRSLSWGANKGMEVVNLDANTSAESVNDDSNTITPTNSMNLTPTNTTIAPVTIPTAGQVSNDIAQEISILSPNVDSGVFSGCGDTDYQRSISPLGKDVPLSVSITPPTPDKNNERGTS